MMPKFASEDADKILARLDRIASTVQANHKQWGMPFEVAKEIVNGLDKTADEIEVATYGEESLQTRQVETAKMASTGKTAEVLQSESDEPYMSAFKNPMAPIQVESDEPYMKAYGPPDQSSAVIHGKSTSGKPLAPGH